MSNHTPVMWATPKSLVSEWWCWIGPDGKPIPELHESADRAIRKLPESQYCPAKSIEEAESQHMRLALCEVTIRPTRVLSPVSGTSE